MAIAVDTGKPIPWWKEPTRDQWHAWVAAWLGWTLDAFDFTIFLLIMLPISQEFHVPLTAVTAVFTLTLWMRLVPLHRGFDGLLVVSAQGRQSGGVDEHFDAAGDARLSSDEPGALEREDHLVDRRRADMESALQIGFGRGATEHLSIGVDKG